MNKWVPRLIGVLVVLVLALFLFNFWFQPQVPEVLQRDLDLQVRGQSVAPPRPQEMPEPEPENTQLTPPALTLTSLEDFPDEGGAAPVLANPKPEPSEEIVAAEPPPPPEPVPTPPPPVAEPKPEPPPAQVANAWIAAGAFGNPDNTRRRVEQLRSRGWPVKTEKIQSGGNMLDRVVLGPIPEGQVNIYLDELSKMGIQGREVK